MYVIQTELAFMYDVRYGSRFLIFNDSLFKKITYFPQKKYNLYRKNPVNCK